MSETSSSWLPTLNTLPNLVELTLKDCQLNCIPPFSQVNFTSLSKFDIAVNNINSNLPDWLWKLNNLRFLDVSFNNFYGSLPALVANLSLLEYCSITGNYLNGIIPESIGLLRSLKELYISGNAFTGTVSEAHFSNMSKLETVKIADNLLAVKISGNWVPPFKLQSLILDFCQVGPKFPTWFKNLHFLRTLSLSNAGIKGPIPDWFINFSSLSFIDMSSNKISGKLSMFSNYTLIKYLDLSNNSFSGPIPSFFCDFKTLDYFILSKNNLYGELPDCWKRNSDLNIIQFSLNNLSGKIPKSICNLSNLAYLQLDDNIFSGTIPSCLINSAILRLLDLGHNKFSGNIPSWNADSQLSVISLRFNILTGIIPNLSHLKSLRILDLSNNNFFGHIPLGIGNLDQVTTGIRLTSILSRYEYQYKFRAITKGTELEFTSSTLKFWAIIDLSENNLIGPIPDELMKLNNLNRLNLSGNDLTGHIPTSIDGLKQLEDLDLSRNKLSGVIPLGLQSLIYLEVLNLSYNNLSGEIPFGSQLQTLDDISIYEGNPYLCGFPLKRSCDRNEDNKQEMHDNGEELIWFYMAITPGFVVGFWLVCGILVLQRKWRIDYFQAIDKLYYMFLKRM